MIESFKAVQISITNRHHYLSLCDRDCSCLTVFESLYGLCIGLKNTTIQENTGDHNC